METTTLDLILALKGNYDEHIAKILSIPEDDITDVNRIACYYSEYSGTDVNHYSEGRCYELLKGAIKDFVAHGNCELYSFIDCFLHENPLFDKKTEFQRWCDAFRTVRVRKSAIDGSCVCVNGFTEEVFKTPYWQRQ